MARKTVPFNKEGIQQLPNNKPVVYRILSRQDTTLYIGSTKRGRVPQRIGEHLKGGMRGTKVRIDQSSSISEARKTEARSIRRSKPPYNKRGK